MNAKLTLKQMALLEKENDREILKLLLHGDKDFRSLCRDIKKSRSAVFDSLKDLLGAEMVGRRKIEDESKGRPRYEYYAKNFYIPHLSRTNLLDFLDMKDVSSKFLTLTEISAIDDLSRYIPVSTESFLNLMLSSGITFKYAIQVMVELGSQLEKNLDYSEFISKTLEVMKENYPIDELSLERFKKKALMEIKAFSENDTVNLTIEEAEKIATEELETSKPEAKFIASNILMTLRLLGINKIPYTTLVNLMYTFTENIGIPCRKTPYFYNVTKSPILEGLTVTVIVKDKREKWSLVNFSDYLLRNRYLEKNKCDFLANLMIEKLLVMRLKEYDIEFIESLSRELLREFGI